MGWEHKFVTKIKFLLFLICFHIFLAGYTPAKNDFLFEKVSVLLNEGFSFLCSKIFID